MTIRYCLILILLFFVTHIDAQLCQGSLGDPVVSLDFGAGPNPGPVLSFPTGYSFVSNDCPNDGFYTVRNNTTSCFGDSWHSLTKDHTGNPNGYFMLVNASVTPGDFYVDTVHGLCTNTTFEFAAWVINVLKPTACQGAGIRPNLTFSIENTDGTILQTFNSGDIPNDATPQWKQYGFYFKTPPGINDVVVRIKNNAPGGCGNDLALDDITFRPCGPLVTATIANNNANTTINLCDGDLTTPKFSATLSTGYTTPAYQWQVSTDNGSTWKDISGATTNSYTRPPTGAGSYQYRLAVSEAGNMNIASCRVASNALTVVVNPLPATTAVNDGPKCSGTAVTLTATGGAAYTWAGPGNFTASGQTVTVNNTTPSGKYVVTVTSSAGCKNNDSTIVALYDNPVTSFISSTPACENGSVQFTDASTAAVGQTITSRSWNFGDGSNIDITSTPTHTFSPAKTYAVTLITITDKTCTDTLVKQVTIHDLPEPDFVLPEVCLSDPFAAFTNTSTIADNSAAQFTYLWNFGDANANAGNPNTSTKKDPQHSYTSVGVYNVQLTVTSKDGCISDTVKTFTVNGALPLAKFSVDNAGSFCSNRDVIITDNSSVNFGNITKVEIFWDYQNNPADKITDEFPANGKKYSYRYADFGNPATKSFVIKYVAYSGINCVNETQQTVTIKASPLVQFAAMNPVCAAVDPFTITQAREVNGISGTGVFTGDGVSNSGLFNPRTAGAGEHSILYTFTATNGCTDALSQTILVYPQPTVNAGPDRTLLEGGYLILDATASGNDITFLWTPNTAIENPLVLTPKVNPVNDITYTLNVTSSEGCISKDDVFVKILKTPLIPNAFSPNGDGINDTWVIGYLESYPGVTVQVYNRYGQAVYRSVNYSKAWDGTYNGTPLPVGTYYYIVDRKITAPKLSGWVTILR